MSSPWRRRQPPALCGCPEPTAWHSDACTRPGPGDRRRALDLDPFRRPAWTADEEAAAIARIRTDRSYARRLADWITGLTTTGKGD